MFFVIVILLRSRGAGGGCVCAVRRWEFLRFSGLRILELGVCSSLFS